MLVALIFEFFCCIQMLLAAGYFRARIPKLHPFDKMLGGLAWCIISSNVEVDVDLHFDEDMTLGM